MARCLFTVWAISTLWPDKPPRCQFGETPWELSVLLQPPLGALPASQLCCLRSGSWGTPGLPFTIPCSDSFCSIHLSTKGDQVRSHSQGTVVPENPVHASSDEHAQLDGGG
jgi:hypothetical protein